MGYNLSVVCHTCRVQSMILRGQEAKRIRQFGAEHSGHDCDCAIDNGFMAEPEWKDVYEEEYRDIFEELHADSQTQEMSNNPVSPRQEPS